MLENELAAGLVGSQKLTFVKNWLQVVADVSNRQFGSFLGFKYRSQFQFQNL